MKAWRRQTESLTNANFITFQHSQKLFHEKDFLWKRVFNFTLAFFIGSSYALRIPWRSYTIQFQFQRKTPQCTFWAKKVKNFVVEFEINFFGRNLHRTKQDKFFSWIPMNPLILMIFIIWNWADLSFALEKLRDKDFHISKPVKVNSRFSNFFNSIVQ